MSTLRFKDVTRNRILGEIDFDLALVAGSTGHACEFIQLRLRKCLDPTGAVSFHVKMSHLERDSEGAVGPLYSSEQPPQLEFIKRLDQPLGDELLPPSGGADSLLLSVQASRASSATLSSVEKSGLEPASENENQVPQTDSKKGKEIYELSGFALCGTNCQSKIRDLEEKLKEQIQRNEELELQLLTATRRDTLSGDITVVHSPSCSADGSVTSYAFMSKAELIGRIHRLEGAINLRNSATHTVDLEQDLINTKITLAEASMESELTLERLKRQISVLKADLRLKAEAFDRLEAAHTALRIEQVRRRSEKKKHKILGKKRIKRLGHNATRLRRKYLAPSTNDKRSGPSLVPEKTCVAL